MKINPTVCPVGNTYQIMVATEEDALISIRVGENNYYYHSNGVRISSAGVHRFTIPMEELDREKEYTVTTAKMLERLPYWPKLGEKTEKKYKFKPIEKTNNIGIYHLSDVHGQMDKAIGAFNYIDKEIDLLIMNGDIVSNASDTFEDIVFTYKVASEITRGEIPCIISRGNHDMRGVGAQNLAQYMPGDEGRSYYTFKVGCIWGILVDAGEDKEDEQEEYNGTICCHEFRLEQERMMKNVIKNASCEYAAGDVRYKLILSHIPFTFVKEKKKFDIERELFSRWGKLIRENIAPDLMLCGHIHKACISPKGSETDDLGHPCTVISGSEYRQNEEYKCTLFAGCYINLSGDKAEVVFNTDAEIIGEYTVEL